MDLSNIFNLEQLTKWGLAHGVKILLIVLAGFIAVKIARFLILRVLRKVVDKTVKLAKKDGRLDEERQKTIVKVIVSLVRTAIWLIALLTILPEFGINIGPLLAGLGVAGLALSFGARGLIQDYLSGLFILIEDHFQLGEEVEVAGKKGRVKDFNLRRTVIEAEEEGKKIIYYIPNDQIKYTVNFSRK